MSINGGTISLHGLVKGECDYYVACKDKKCAVYHKDGKKVSKDFAGKYLYAYKINFNENLGIVEMFDKKGNLIKSVDFNPVYPRKKEEFLDYTKLLNI